MDGIQEIDSVLQQVRQAARRFRLPSDAVITQQILLFGQAFYGYRFCTANFTAIWSATDQILKIFNLDGRVLASVPLSENADETAVETIPLTPHRMAA